MTVSDAAAKTLERLADTYWSTVTEANPLFATSIGDHRFDDRMPDESPEGIAAMRARLAEIGRAAGDLDADALEATDRVTLSALREDVAGDIAGIDAGLARWNVDPLDGAPTGLLNVPSYQEPSTPDDGARLVARWRAMGGYVDTHVENLRRAAGDGLTACRAPVERVIDQLGSLLAQPTAEWPLSEPARRMPEAWPRADRDRFARYVTKAVDDAIRPALVRLHATLRDEILPIARPTDRPGIGHLPGGAAAYRDLIRVHTSLPLTPEALHDTGVREVARIDAEFVELARRTLGTRSLEEGFDRLRSDPALHFSTRDEVYETAVRGLERANAAIPAWFRRLPKAECAVVRMGPHEEEHSTIAYYRQPAVDGSRPGQYYINTSAPETRPRYEAEALAYHEAVPGHHLQIAIGQELDGIPEFRRHLGPTSFFEGWGLYTERLADEMGLYTADLDRIGVLSFDAWRACRLVVDTGMHALGWSRDRAIEYMAAHSALAANNIVNEVDRYIVWPGQAVAYKTGQLEILRLRSEARQRLGDRFDIRAFHDAVLDGGALPLRTLADVVTSRLSG